MPGSIGAPWDPNEDVTAEQWVLTPLTSDPASTSEGDMWLRTDLDSGDKIATVRFDHGSGVWDIPVFATGTSENGVEEVLRIATPNGNGYIPIHDESPAFAGVGFQHNGTRYGFHDSVDALPRVIDGFEDGDLSEYSGETSDYDVITNGAPEGDNYLSFVTTNQGNPSMWSTSGLNYYPEQGDVISFLAKNDDTANGSIEFWFGVQDVDNWYKITNLSRGNDTLSIVKSVSGSGDVLAQQPVTWSNYQGQWLWNEIEWGTNGDIVLRVFETDASFEKSDYIQGVSTNDTTYTSGGIGFQVSSSTDAQDNLHYDYVHKSADVSSPVTAVALWDAQALTGYSNTDRITSWGDSVGSFDLSDGDGLDYIDSQINGHPAAYSDGSNDNLGRDAWGQDYDQPFTVSGVMQLNSTTGSNQVALSWLNSSGSAAGPVYPENTSGNKAIYNGNSFVEDGAADTSWFAYVAVFDGADSVLNVDGTEYTGDPGSRTIDGSQSFRIGSVGNGTNRSDCYHGEHALHDSALDSDQRTNEINRLTNKWS